MSPGPKVFIVGFHKTGTKSVTAALRQIGYRLATVSVPLNRMLLQNPGNADATIQEVCLEAATRSDGMQDSPCCFLHTFFDQRFPGSKFILTSRDTDSWMRSYRSFFPDTNTPLRRWMYGVERFSGHEAQYRRVYEQQNAAIREHFSDRPADFLEMDLGRGHGWREVESLLGRRESGPFPWENAARS